MSREPIDSVPPRIQALHTAAQELSALGEPELSAQERALFDTDGEARLAKAEAPVEMAMRAAAVRDFDELSLARVWRKVERRVDERAGSVQVRIGVRSWLGAAAVAASLAVMVGSPSGRSSPELARELGAKARASLASLPGARGSDRAKQLLRGGS